MNPAVQKLHIVPDMLPRFSQVFQKGIRVEIETGCTLESLLYDQWGLPTEYVLEKISTLFLNGKPVDDISTARIGEGAVLALSSAMPGLVGAVMRRDGFFSSLRGTITYREEAQADSVRRGLITVKLFNLLIGELGPRFLTRGFFIDPGDLPDDLAQGLDKEYVGGVGIFVVDDLN
jgi:hypothetical protein